MARGEKALMAKLFSTTKQKVDYASMLAAMVAIGYIGFVTVMDLRGKKRVR